MSFKANNANSPPEFNLLTCRRIHTGLGQSYQDNGTVEMGPFILLSGVVCARPPLAQRPPKIDDEILGSRGHLFRVELIH